MNYPDSLKANLPQNNKFIKIISCCACVLTAFLYGAIITQIGNGSSDEQFYYVIREGSQYAILTGVSIGLFWFIKMPIKKYNIRDMLVIFTFVSLGYYFAFAKISRLDFGVCRAGIYGTLGVMVYWLLGLSHRKIISTMTNRLKVPMSKANKNTN